MAEYRLRCVLTLVLLTLVLAISLAGCGGGGGGNPPSPGSGEAIPQFDHVVILIEENQSYSSVIGNPVAPYFNSLATRYGLATNYFADTHPSLPNYFMLTTGATIAVDDGFTGTVTQDNIVRALVNAGKTWHCYADGLPYVGYLGSDVGEYAHHHNPFAYFSDVINNAAQAANVVPAFQLSADLSGGNLPNYAFIVPNNIHNGHDCVDGADCSNDDKVAQIDGWLQATVQPILADAAFQSSGLLIVTFDEAADTDTTHGGGQVATLVISSKGKSGFQGTALYQHESVLALSMTALRVSDLPGAAATAPAMSEFFQQ